MMSERKFSTTFTSFWNELLPTADSFVRRMNLSCDRYCLPTHSNDVVNSNRRAVINELSFRLFMSLAKGKELSYEEKLEISVKVTNYIQKLAPNVIIDKAINREEIREAESLSLALETYFNNRELETMKFWPLFKGCGKMHACKGDIICQEKLIEVKAGNRQFRITDVRQIITYLCLNYISKQYQIERVALVNPRKGLSFETTVEMLVDDCSRRKPVGVFGDIIDFLSTESISI